MINMMTYRIILVCLLLVGSVRFATGQPENRNVSDSSDKMEVDFGYAFSTPHRLTVSMPNASDKTLVDVYPDKLRLKWSYDNLLSIPMGSFCIPDPKWHVFITTELDGKVFENGTWQRGEDWLPMVETVYSKQEVTTKMQIIGAESAALVCINMVNNDSKKHRVTINCSNDRKTTTYNPAWVQSDWNSDVLLAGMEDRADRVNLFMTGGDEQPVKDITTISQVWNLEPGEKRTGWIVRPYVAYHSQLTTLRKQDWEKEFNRAKEAWYNLMEEAVKIHIPDPAVQNAFYAGLADCFIMREPVSSEYVASTPGTEKYRAANTGEASIVAIFLDQVGLQTDAAKGFQLIADMQGEDGNWNDPKGWAHYMWAMAGFKSWALMEHYRMTGDVDYLRSLYPRMLASSRWQETQRAKTRKLVDGKRTPDYGLMPRGMGDCGLWDGDDLFGVFLPHNIWAVFADSLALEAARILGKDNDIEELAQIHRAALNDLKWSLEHGAISENGYRWIPGVANKTDGSRWGALYAAYPCATLPRNHELINGTISKIESFISPGGIPVNTGWLKDGLWVAIALDNLAEGLLHRNEGDKAIQYLYATLNHATPLISWCEERGQEPGATDATGDLQHLWTPLSVGRFLRDALVMEDQQTLHLARGTARQWLEDGQKVSALDMPTHFGPVSYALKSSKKKVTGFIDLTNNTAKEVVLHIRLPKDKDIVSVDSDVHVELDARAQTITVKNVNERINLNFIVK